MLYFAARLLLRLKGVPAFIVKDFDDDELPYYVSLPRKELNLLFTRLSTEETWAKYLQEDFIAGKDFANLEKDTKGMTEAREYLQKFKISDVMKNQEERDKFSSYLGQIAKVFATSSVTIESRNFMNLLNILTIFNKCGCLSPKFRGSYHEDSLSPKALKQLTNQKLIDNLEKLSHPSPEERRERSDTPPLENASSSTPSSAASSSTLSPSPSTSPEVTRMTDTPRTGGVKRPVALLLSPTHCQRHSTSGTGLPTIPENDRGDSPDTISALDP